MHYSDELVRRVNRLFHDIEAGRYDDEHPEIFEHEPLRWRRIAQRFMTSRPRPVSVLDVGSGTGFVPLQIAHLLHPQDTLICSDISAEMLRVCRQNLERRLTCQLEFLELSGERIDRPDKSFFWVTMNSVLHHVPNLKLFLSELSRLVQSGGFLFVAHEPHMPFFEHPFLRRNYRIVLNLTHARRIAGSAARRLGAERLIARYSRRAESESGKQSRYALQINEALLREEIIDHPLTTVQISEIVDIHSPTAGRGGRRDPDLMRLLREYLPDFRVVHFETYRHLAKATYQNRWTMAYDKLLARFWPDTGSTFFVVMQKQA